MNKQKNLFQILELMTRYQSHFVEKLGGFKEFQAEVDKVLDLIIQNRIALEKFDEENEG